MEICKGGYGNHYAVIKKPFIKFEKSELLKSDEMIGYIDGFPVCALKNNGCISVLQFDKNNNVKGSIMGYSTLWPVRVKFKDKLNAMRKAYLHIPAFLSEEVKSKFDSFDKYYKKVK